MEEEAAQEEQVMSELHIGCPPGSSGPHISLFTITIPPGSVCAGSNGERCIDLFRSGEVPMHRSICADEDGDLVLTRRSQFSTHNLSLTISHNITSSISNVGLQVWKAELVLSDFVLHKMFTSSEFDGIVSIELGAGTGLVGMLLASVAKKVFLTDRGDHILENCAKNVHLNARVLNYKAVIHVRELDWSSWPPTDNVGNSTAQSYCWTSAEIEEAQGASLLLAADVIYSDDLTDALFSFLERLMSLAPRKVLYLALEKCYNFSLDDLDVVANGYSRFLSYLRDGEENKDIEDEHSQCFVGKRIDLSLVPQYVGKYERGNDVEVWCIEYKEKK